MCVVRVDIVIHIETITLKSPIHTCKPLSRFMPKMPDMVVIIAMEHVSAVKIRSVVMS